MKYYRTSEGIYLGGYDDALTPPAGAIEVPAPPEDARQGWDAQAGAWGTVPPPEWLPFDAFLALIPPTRQNAIVTDAIAAGVLGYLLAFIAEAASQGVRLAAPRTVQALALLLSQGLITQAEHDALAAGQPVP